jgi:hypothetical protein
MKWMASPLISVVNYGRAFSFASLGSVVIRSPVAGDFAGHRERRAWRIIRDGLFVEPPLGHVRSAITTLRRGWLVFAGR